MIAGGIEPLRILTFTSLYPNAAKPQHGIFVETRLRQLVDSGQVKARVLAPVPYFPFAAQRFGSYALFARVPREERRHGIEIDHPRFLTIPKVGMSIAPFLLYAGARRVLRQLLKAGHKFDLIDAHYFYPDGVAAAMLGREFGLPVIVTARGTDINLIPDYALPRRMILWAAGRADGLIAVSSALAEKMITLGMERTRIHVLRNGVDSDVFMPTRGHSHHSAPSPGPLAISVGNLVPLKGHDLVIKAMTHAPDLHLWIVGGGPERARLEALAGRIGVGDRTRFLGTVPYEEMPKIYSAADILVLASEREGWPNVLLEAMACGTPVVAAGNWASPELLARPEAGRQVAQREPGAIAEAILEILVNPPSRAKTRAYAEGFSWHETTKGQIELFRAILRPRGANDA